MSIKVIVLKNEIDERGGSFKNDAGENVEYTTRKQKAKLETGGFAYPFDVLQVNKGVASLSKFTVLRMVPKAAPRAATP